MVSESNRWIGATLCGGRYRIARELGRGGMAVAYLAENTVLKNNVVVKAPRRSIIEEEPQFAERFAEEIRLLVELTHPHIVKITDVGEHEGLPFAVLDYLPGGSLDDRLRESKKDRRKKFACEEVAVWLGDVAEVLDFVYSKGSVHRDVKPANLLFDAHGNIFLSDFGVTKTMASMGGGNSQAMTATGLVLGTPAYMAPEIILGHAFDGRSDQYSLAVTVYELLGGQRPFEAEGTAVFFQQTSQEPRPLVELEKSIPPGAAAVVHRGLSKSPQDRYPTCSAFMRAFVKAIEETPTKFLAACPNCQAKIQFPARKIGKTFPCPSCKSAITLSREIAFGSSASSSSVNEPTQSQLLGGTTAQPIPGEAKSKSGSYPTQAQPVGEGKSSATPLRKRGTEILKVPERTQAARSPLQDVRRPTDRSPFTAMVLGGLSLFAVVVAAGMFLSRNSEPSTAAISGSNVALAPIEALPAVEKLSRPAEPRPKDVESLSVRSPLVVDSPISSPKSSPVATAPRSNTVQSTPPADEKPSRELATRTDPKLSLAEEKAQREQEKALSRRNEAERRAKVFAAVARKAPLPIFHTSVDVPDLVELSSGRQKPKVAMPKRVKVTIPQGRVHTDQLGRNFGELSTKRVETPESRINRAKAVQKAVEELIDEFADDHREFSQAVREKGPQNQEFAEEFHADLKELDRAADELEQTMRNDRSAKNREADAKKYNELLAKFAVKFGDESTMPEKFFTDAVPPGPVSKSAAAADSSSDVVAEKPDDGAKKIGYLRQKAKGKREAADKRSDDPKAFARLTKEADELEQQANDLDRELKQKKSDAAKEPSK